MSRPPLPARYQDVCLIGEGGFGRVFLALDGNLNRQVAIKIPHEDLDDVGRGAAFLEEAQRASTLEHPNVITIYDFELEDEFPYLTMEFASGGTLDGWIAGGPTDPKKVAQAIREAADGLAYAHARGIIHRDVKPSNLLVSKAGVVKVGDFGLARVMGPEGTTSYGAAGTDAYMAPEQQAGGVEIGPEVDVFALAVTAYELLAGARHGGFPVMTSSSPPPRLSAVRDQTSRAVDAILDEALALRSSERNGDVLRFARDLGDALVQGTRRPGAMHPQRRERSPLANLTVAGIIWSGSASPRESALQNRVALIEDGCAGLVGNVTRDDIGDLLDEMHESSSRALVGIDFCFGLPAWYLRDHGYASAPDFWDEIARIEDAFGREGSWPTDQLSHPFWGQGFRERPKLADERLWFRETEDEVRERTTVLGSSVFQLSGIGSVGSRSARGWGRLREFRSSGWAVWPFDPPAPHTILEIFPLAYRNLVVGTQIVGDAGQRRRALLDAMNHDLHLDFEQSLTLQEDSTALDAMLGAWLLWRTDPRLPDLSNDPVAMAEGRIWLPG